MMVASTEIPWTGDPLPRIELLPAENLLALDHGDLLEYAYDLQRDLIAVRETLQESCALNGRLTRQLRRALAVVYELRKHVAKRS